MSRTTVGVAIVMSMFSGTALAQGPGLERVVPDAYLWQPHPDGITVDPKMASIVSFQIHVPLWQSPLDPRIPEEAAQLFMAKIRAELTAQRLHAGNISVFLHGFGAFAARA